MPHKKEPRPNQRPTAPVPVVPTPASPALSNAPPWLPELERWEQAPYDGIKGSPPEWVPPPFRKKFYSARGDLFNVIDQNTARYPEIRSRFDDLVKNKYYAFALAMMKDKRLYDESLFFLVDLYKKVQLGEVEGLRQLAGDAAVAGARSQTGYTKRNDFRDKPRVQQIGRDKWAASPHATIKDIISSTELEPYQYTEKTLRKWLSEIDPRPSTEKRGRPPSRK